MSFGTFPEHLGNVWVYLRKSREDREAEERARREGRGDIETLSRHRRKLFQLASKFQWRITRVFEEVVSGEFISERPEMQKLLQGVEKGETQAVLTMDIDRLGRGDMEDQGRIMRVFREAGTLILTPDKVYDLCDEMDEEWTEFKAFFARRELKMITKRMQQGRITSVQDGKYLGTRPPFGYDVNDDRILIPNQDADTVRLIFDLHVNRGMGGSHIASYLNTLGIKTPTGKSWRAANVVAILRNAHYAGYVVWGRIKHDKRKGTYTKRPEEEVIRAKGRHTPLISIEVFEASAQIRASRSHAPLGFSKQIANPLAGLIECSKCGEKLIRRPYTKQGPHLICKNPNCPQRSTRLDIVEQRVVQALREWLCEYTISCDEVTAATNAPTEAHHNMRLLTKIEDDIRRLETQRDNLHNLLEQGIYDAATYRDRKQKLVSELSTLAHQKERLMKDIDREIAAERTPQKTIPHVIHVLDLYPNMKTPAEQNRLLRTVLYKAVYNKEKHQRGAEFDLDLYPLF
ncbi:recombinase family protein [Alicyclobacillus acidoterrestris]|uniref:Recombinase family protein n=1 Tax=Alicyclobacillus acidoterrestris (strain ATCC 49025 / DSM 3922 / CIP 106132 / NCIMB 13137 / GD3B) TaxID=1356854 RepID=T0CZ98_ALIAG|nr:recombinase family protein [Alicyclobacillus acidoterrestris]EPZ44602.1 serine recombinase [Alicyclobacillus acidoterrestris ATCC 49025]UNO50330.1 recombinase family protein [Alicyclobacillus acidoterrestris]